MKSFSLPLLLSITFSFFMDSSTVVLAQDAVKPVKKSVTVTGVGSRVPVFISERTASGTKRLGSCITPCREKIKSSGAFYVTLTPISDDYLTPIHRESEEAIIEEDNYKFDISLGTPDEEGRRYLKPYLDVFRNKPERLKCMEFTKADLSERPKTCFSFPPITPAKAKRSGRCKISVRILTDGSTEDIRVVSCSEKLFELPSVETAKLFRYYPHIVDGEIKTSRMTKKINYQLLDSRGKRIPGKGEK